MNKKIRAIGAACLVAIWAGLTALAWFGPDQAESVSERRPLEQWPGITGESLWSGSFMEDFGDYSLDQFPLRDPFRQIKSLFHYYALQQKDNNGIYIADGYAVKMEYPLNTTSVNYAMNRFQHIYDTYLKDSGSKVIFAPVPDKGYYLAEENGYLSLDYEKMFAMLRENMPWAEFVDITDCLDASDYYYTDTHWRQEHLLDVAGKLSEALGVTPPKAEDFTVTQLDTPFYGVYYGQAALPMNPESIYLMESQLLEDCQVYDHETGKYTPVYNLEKMSSRDPYEVYLSGTRALLTIENPNASTDRELVVFRDSFGSSLVPLLVQDYAKVTLVDIRYVASDFVGQFVDFHGQDVLFLYSTLVLNSSSTLK